MHFSPTEEDECQPWRIADERKTKTSTIGFDAQITML
jgi:hypothetical protein